MRNNKNVKLFHKGFTIVELLVVIAVIGILAAITTVAYTGVNQGAIALSLKSDLVSSSDQLKLFRIDNGSYPPANNCPAPEATEICLKASGTNIYGYKSSPTSFILVSMNGNTCYSITNNSAPVENCVTIGTQTWMKYNLDVGDRIIGATNQTNNSIVEKYCYNNDPANCTTYGGLYQWNEAMQYDNTPGAQGICPTGFHIPTDNDWKILEMQLGMTQAQADVAYDWRGTDQGTQLKSGGSSGLNMPFAGNILIGGAGASNGLLSAAYLWSSSESGANAWYRYLDSGNVTVYRSVVDKAYGFSVRCLLGN